MFPPKHVSLIFVIWSSPESPFWMAMWLDLSFFFSMQQWAHLIIFFVPVNQMDLWGSSQLFAMVVATRTWPNYVLQHLSSTCSTVTFFHVTSFFFEEFPSCTFSGKDGFHICSLLAYLFSSQYEEILPWEAAVGNSSSLLILWPFYSPGKMSTAECGVVTTNTTGILNTI